MKPIKIEQICNLKEVSFHENIPYYKFGKTVFQNSHIITIHETNPDGMNYFVAYDFQEKKILYKLPSRADSILIHENMQIVAFRQFNFESNMTNIQIYNLELKQKQFDKSFAFKVEFWKFLTNQIIIVSQTSVSYLDIYQEQELKLLFERSGQFQQEQMQIIGIDSDYEQNWLALKGISLGNLNMIEGHILLNKKDKNITQYISGFTVAFGKAQLHSENYESSLISFIQNGLDQNSKKLYITELDTPPDGYQKFKQCITIYDQQINDFPLFMHIFKNYGVLMSINKSGIVQLYELSEQVKIFSEKITDGAIFAGIQNQQGDVFYVITNEGQVLSISIIKQSLTNFLVNQYNQEEKIINLAEKLSFKYNIPHYYEYQ